MRAKSLCTVLSLCLLTSTASWAATRMSASAALADVTVAVNAAADGDTVSIPAGSVTWSGTLTVTKGITIQGAGIGATNITAGAAITLIQFNPGSDKAFRLTGVTLNGGTYTVDINGSTNGSYVLDKFRIDHNSFNTNTTSIHAGGWLEGLIDHNQFLNANRGILVQGDNNYAWARTIAAGTSHALFIEDNTWTITNAGGAGLNECVYHQEGGRTVIRYNTFDASTYTADNAYFLDSHGHFIGMSARGQPILEIYNNTFNAYRIAGFMNIRGGSLLVHDNDFTVATGSPTAVHLTEEESWYSGILGSLRTQWPAEDQVNNTFIWNNTLHGFSTIVTSWHPEDAPFIQKDRDYFLHAPEGAGGPDSVGYEYYTGTMQGGAQTPPTTGDAGSMAFSATGANKYYPYTPYAYPHPLQGASSGPAAPTGLRLVP